MEAAAPTASIQIGVVGRGMVGKTALIQRCRTDEFHAEYIPTEYEVYRIEMILNDEPMNVDVGDAGSVPPEQEFIEKNIINSHGFILMYDITRKETFDALLDLRNRIMKIKKVRANLPLVLVGNKIDLEAERAVPSSRGSDLAQRWNCPFFETSALTGVNVKEVFAKALEEIEEKRLHPVKEKQMKCCNII